MTESEAKKLRVGDRVTWDHNAKDCGTVFEVGYNAVKVQWDDPSQGEGSVLWHSEMANIGKAV